METVLWVAVGVALAVLLLIYVAKLALDMSRAAAALDKEAKAEKRVIHEGELVSSRMYQIPPVAIGQDCSTLDCSGFLFTTLRFSDGKSFDIHGGVDLTAFHGKAVRLYVQGGSHRVEAVGE